MNNVYPKKLLSKLLFSTPSNTNIIPPLHNTSNDPTPRYISLPYIKELKNEQHIIRFAKRTVTTIN